MYTWSRVQAWIQSEPKVQVTVYASVPALTRAKTWNCTQTYISVYAYLHFHPKACPVPDSVLFIRPALHPPYPTDRELAINCAMPRAVALDIKLLPSPVSDFAQHPDSAKDTPLDSPWGGTWSLYLNWSEGQGCPMPGLQCQGPLFQGGLVMDLFHMLH